MHDFTKWAVSIITGAAAAFFGQYGLFFVFVAVAVVLDVLTGLIKAKATGEGLSSKKANRGFWRKMALFAALAFGIFLDYAAGAVLVKAGVSFAGELPFALIVCSYIIINESISIAENLYLANPDSFPQWIAKKLKVAKEEIEQKGNKGDGRTEKGDGRTEQQNHD
jgi:toxin secretion/phage lysis holin